jgi:GNAT superfamily N-acetyltransferase
MSPPDARRPSPAGDTATGIDRRTFALGSVPALLIGHQAAAAGLVSVTGGGVSIRPWEGGDGEAVAALVAMHYDTPEDRRNGTFHGLNGLFQTGGPRPGRRLLVASAGGRVVGAGAASPASPIHPVGRVHVIVSPDSRRRGIGTRLYRPLHDAVAAQGLMPIAGIGADEAGGFAFAEYCGMRPLMRERHYFVDLRSWPVDRWCANALERPSPYRFIRGDQVQPAVLWQALWGAYHESHRFFVPTLNRPDELERSMKAVIDPRKVVIALESGTPAGAAALLVLRQDSPLVLYPCSATRPMASAEQERALVARLVADRLASARNDGHAELMINCEDLDGRLVPVMADVPVRDIYEYYTLTSGVDAYWPRSAA